MRPVEAGQLRRWILPPGQFSPVLGELDGVFIVLDEDDDGLRIYDTACWYVLRDGAVESWTERALLSQSEVIDEAV